MQGVLRSGRHWAALAVAVGGLTFAAAAEGAVIGQKNMSLDDGAVTCIGGTCTFAYTKIPNADAAAPFTGTIVSWKVSVPPAHDTLTNTGPLRLQVLKRALDDEGLANDSFKVLRETDDVVAIPGTVNTFTANLKIRKGQFIGLAGNDTTEIVEVMKPKSTFLNWSGVLIPGDPPRAPTIADRGRYALFNARLVQVTG